jgi:hypothetical protein
MLNLFVFAAYPKLEKSPWITNQEHGVQDQGQPNCLATPWHHLTVALGKALIGLGSKLAEEEAQACAPGALAS